MHGVDENSLKIINPNCASCDNYQRDPFYLDVTAIRPSDNLAGFKKDINLNFLEIQSVVNTYFDSVIKSSENGTYDGSILPFEFCLKPTDLNLNKIEAYADVAGVIKSVADERHINVKFSYVSTVDVSINSEYRGFLSKYFDKTHSTDLLKLNFGNGVEDESNYDEMIENESIISDFTDGLCAYYGDILVSNALNLLGSKIYLKHIRSYINHSLDILNDRKIKKFNKEGYDSLNSIFLPYFESQDGGFECYNLINEGDSKINNILGRLNQKGNVLSEEESVSETKEYHALAKIRKNRISTLVEGMSNYLIEYYLAQDEDNVVKAVNAEKERVLGLQEFLLNHSESFKDENLYLHNFLKGLLESELQKYDIELDSEMMDNFTKTNLEHRDLHNNKVIISNERSDEHIKKYIDLYIMGGGQTPLVFLLKE